ncbi:calcium dodecin [bacterium MnTg02]|nr:calcium dodecin [bacterium MnTg02]
MLHFQYRPGGIAQDTFCADIVYAEIMTLEQEMAESVYKVVELVGTSTESWEKAATAAVNRASQSLRDLRVAEVTAQDLVIEDGRVSAFRTKIKVSFKFEGKAD